MSEERDLDLNEKDDIRMEDSRYEHWRDVSEYGKDNSKVRVLRWNLYTKENEDFIYRKNLVSVPYQKGVKIVWTCVKDNIIEGKEYCEDIGLLGFGYKLFEGE